MSLRPLCHPFWWLLCLAASASALEVAVDDSARWYDLGASHHGQHALGGAAIGALGYGAAALVTDQRDRRLASGIALGAVAGVGFELLAAERGGDGHGENLVDPIDAAWVVVGAAAGALLADLTHEAITIAATPTSVGAAVAWRF